MDHPRGALLLRVVRRRRPPGPAAQPPRQRDEGQIVERLRQNPHTAKCHLRVDVKQAVVILQGDVDSRVAKRTAGDDCWDTLGVADVSNQLSVAGDAAERETLRVRDVMTADPVALLADATLRDIAAAMRNADIGSVVLIDAERTRWASSRTTTSWSAASPAAAASTRPGGSCSGRRCTRSVPMRRSARRSG